MTAYCFAARECFKRVKIMLLDLHDLTKIIKATFLDRSGATPQSPVHMRENFLLYEEICESLTISEEGFPQI
jgi:hypothetical protein